MLLQNRPRINRTTAAVRQLVAETHVQPSDFIVPLFIIEGKGIREEISSMPNYYRFSIDFLAQEVKDLWAMGIRSVLLFVKVADHLKDNTGKEALNPNGLLPEAVRVVKNAVPEMCVMTDVALDPFNTFGHDGIVENGEIVNDRTAEVLAQMSVVHALAGADFVAPSDMMDGRVGAIRQAFEANNLHKTGILSYGAKYASCLYGPFRDALDSAPGFGDKKTYQMDIRNSREAIREVLLDQAEGADMIMVKPAGMYLDIIAKVRASVNVPIVAYQVSGEYAMIKAAAERGWVNEQNAIAESLIAIKRAGADMIATYFAKDFIKGIMN